ncbi:RNA-binding protein 26-like [Centruroides sculpturatus]|uniref:RNA-binding protein 26-like n=1 Tax=Centruroides sculpturatus TaxID=218467 RepID=UPI000C6D48C4|nr:RNA-binding protein 26-like [Centruroides sculpturatus]
MIIESPEALKEWLTACLEPKCDADPQALARYVMALVKKDKPEKDLKDICLDQLDVFLQKETKPFVDLLFETLNNKSYLRLNATNSGPISNNLVMSSLDATTNNSSASNANSSTINGNAATSSGRSSGNRLSQNSTTVTSVTTSATFKSDVKKTKEGFCSEPEGRERRHRSRSRSRSGSRSPVGRGGIRTRSRSRENDDRRGRRFAEDDRRRRVSVRRFENRYRDFRDRRLQDNTDRDRSRERERERDRESRSARERTGRDRTVPNERDRSRSRSGSWSRNRSRSRSGTWSRSPSRSHSRSRSRSRSWSRSRDRSRDRNRNEAHETRSRGDTTQLTVDHGDTDYRLGAHSTVPAVPAASAVAPIPPVSSVPSVSLVTTTEVVTTLATTQSTSSETNQFVGKTAKRCRDYDEMGYCMRGDLCPYDHGNDPVVVEDVSVLGFGPNTATAPPVSQPSGNNIHTNTMHHVITPIIGQPPTRSPLPPPPPPQPEPYIPEPYNPEAPGMDRTPRLPPPFWTPTGPPPIRASGPRGPAPQLPPPSAFLSSHPQRTRELIGVPTVDDTRDLNVDSPKISNNNSSGNNNNNNRMVIEPQRPVLNMPCSQTIATTASSGLITSTGAPHINHSNEANMKRRPFDYSRLGPRKQANMNNDRCILELRKVPRHLNSIAHLNSHFSKFGNIVNLQVCYDGDPEAALIQFNSHAEANAAYRSTEAVLNNRFVKVFWHNKDGTNNSNQQPQQQQQQQQQQPPQQQQQQPQQAQNQQKQTQISQLQEQNGISETNLTKPSVKERLGLQLNISKANSISHCNQTANSTLEEATERSVVFSPTGNLSRTVFNPSVLKKTNVPSSLSSLLPRKSKEEQKKNALKKKMEVQKKRQQLLQTNVQQHKLLVEKLEKCKNEKEKVDIKETLQSLVKTIEKLQMDIRKEASEISQLSLASNHRIPKAKAEAEKELLDAEMDLYNKQHTGDDTTELRRRVNELKQQARALGLLDGRSVRGKIMKTLSRRSTGVLRGSRSLLHHNLTSVDHRPRKIILKGLNDTEKDNILPHFIQYAEVENIEHTTGGTVVTFKTRRDAELAISHGSKFNDRVLTFAWYKELSANPSNATSELEGLDDDLAVDDDNQQSLLDEGEEDLLLGDDEEEEDSEARSWRR